MLDREQDPMIRLRAAKQLGPLDDSASSNTTMIKMSNVFWSDAQPMELRLYLLDLILERNPDYLWLTSQRYIRQLDNKEVLAGYIDRVVGLNDRKWTSVLVRSLARPSPYTPDTERLEYQAIAQLNPGKEVSEAIWDVVKSDQHGLDIAPRIDAYTLINRLQGENAARQRLRDETSDHIVIRHLKGSQWLGRLPDNREGMLWLLQIRSKRHVEFWEKAEARAAHLTDDQRRGLELRHLPVLLLTSHEEIKDTRLDLISSTSSKLQGRQGAIREHAGNARKLPSESFSDHADLLCWADLRTIDLLLTAMNNRSLVTSLFTQADADMADTTTEHGGVLLFKNFQLIARTFPPVQRIHDQAFYASDDLIKQMYTGLCHYHFHAQKHRNAEYAGPGVGDLKFVNNLRANALVFTFLDENTLNVDYYQPDGVVIDMGVIKRN